MELKLVWHKPVALREAEARTNLLYELDLEKIPATPGVYIFMRTFGKNQNPLYVGKAKNLGSRIKGQLNTLKLMRGIQNAAHGSRVLVFGEFVPKQAQRVDKCLTLIERALIRHFLSEGHELLNKAGTRLAKHSLLSEQVAGRFVPHKILFE
jgi:hypothetical protein